MSLSARCSVCGRLHISSTPRTIACQCGAPLSIGAQCPHRSASSIGKLRCECGGGISVYTCMLLAGPCVPHSPASWGREREFPRATTAVCSLCDFRPAD